MDLPQNRKAQKFKHTPKHTKKRLPEITFRYPPKTHKIQNSYFGYIFLYVRAMFSISCCEGNSDVGLVCWVYFGVWGGFLSVADQ